MSASVLILYPSGFNCYSKFKRKVEKIISALNSVRLLSVNDNRGFIKRISTESYSAVSADNISSDEIIDKATHAIIFSDGSSFINELSVLTANKIPVREISVILTKVVNADKKQAYDVYIGRGSPWGNPYAIGEDGDREEVIHKFHYDFDRGFFTGGNRFKSNEEYLNELQKLSGKKLGCHCKPEACHGDVLADYLNSLDDGQ